MTTGDLSRFVLQRPFEPFVMGFSGGREIAVNHSDQATLDDTVLP